MAGDNSSIKDDCTIKLDNVVLNWMFDFTCHRSWQQFSKAASISESDKDIIQGLSGLLSNSDINPNTDSIKQKWLFMVILCRLDDGEDITVQYDDSSEESPLESMLSPFEDLVKLQETSLSLKQEGKKLLSIIKSEIILVFCRAMDLDRAKRALDKLWQSEHLNNEDKRTRKLLKQIIENKKTLEENKKLYTYKDFLETMRKYLGKIFKQFPKPLLLEAAEKRLESEKQIEEREKGSESGKKRKYKDMSFTRESVKDSSSTAAAECEKDHTEKTKLRKLWSKNVSELFAQSPLHENSEKGDMAPPSVTPKKTTPKKQTLGPPQSPVSRKQTPAIPPHTEDCPTSTTGENNPPSPSTSSKGTTSRADMTYKKNIGRSNRHEPSEKNKNKNNTDWDIQSMNCSMMSMGTRTKWTEDEAEELFDAVHLIGVGKWREIKDYLNTQRSNVNLKDKWRTMLKTGDVTRIAKAKTGTKKK